MAVSRVKDQVLSTFSVPWAPAVQVNRPCLGANTLENKCGCVYNIGA